ncbi:hypothetical protein ACLOJK_035436 [Asimina triloba]
MGYGNGDDRRSRYHGRMAANDAVSSDQTRLKGKRIVGGGIDLEPGGIGLCFLNNFMQVKFKRQLDRKTEIGNVGVGSGAFAVKARGSPVAGSTKSELSLNAVDIKLLSSLNREDLKKLCDDNYPEWISFPMFEQKRNGSLRAYGVREVELGTVPFKQVFDSSSGTVLHSAATLVIRESVEPVLEEYRPAGISSLKFGKLTLGTVPPKIEGIRVQNLKKGQITMDIDLRWGGNPNIVLAVEALVASLPIQLKDLQVFTVIRVIFQLAEEIPCISAVVVALLSEGGFIRVEDIMSKNKVRESIPKPRIDYTLKAVGGSLTAIPGLSDMIDDTVTSIITDQLQWPRRIVVPLGGVPVDTSDLELKPQGKLFVTVVKATGLKNMEMIGKSDPYTVVYVRPLFKVKTKVVDNNLNPVWNQIFELIVEDKETQALIFEVGRLAPKGTRLCGLCTPAESAFVRVTVKSVGSICKSYSQISDSVSVVVSLPYPQVFDEDVGQDKRLGITKLPLIDLEPEKLKELELRLLPSLDMLKIKDKKDRGTVTVKVLYHQFNKEEHLAALEEEKRILEERRKLKEAGLIGSTMDALDGAVSLVGSGVGLVGTGIGAGVGLVGTGIGTGAGLVGTGIGAGAGIVGSGIGAVGTGLTKAGKFMGKSVTGQFGSAKRSGSSTPQTNENGSTS